MQGDDIDKCGGIRRKPIFTVRSIDRLRHERLLRDVDERTEKPKRFKHEGQYAGDFRKDCCVIQFLAWFAR